MFVNVIQKQRKGKSMSYFPSFLSLCVIIQMVYEGGEGLKVWNDELPLESLSQEDYVTANTS